ncbi:hypothetical protein DJ530_12485 [Sulfolobus sp. E1]|nr:hypothetical protein DJ530_12485 [Sulfolobus sp. E1]
MSGDLVKNANANTIAKEADIPRLMKKSFALLYLSDKNPIKYEMKILNRGLAITAEQNNKGSVLNKRKNSQ